MRDTYAARLAARKLAIVNALVKVFQKSGVKYTCAAAVINTVKNEAQALCHAAGLEGYHISAGRMARRAADEIHKQWSATNGQNDG